MRRSTVLIGILYKTSYLNEEVNCTEPSPSDLLFVLLNVIMLNATVLSVVMLNVVAQVSYLIFMYCVTRATTGFTIPLDRLIPYSHLEDKMKYKGLYNKTFYFGY
jgi:hypothetical protein